MAESGTKELAPRFPEDAAGQQINYGRMPFMTSTVGLFGDLNRPFRMLEIGSWVGSSMMIWGEAISQFAPKGGEITCVDPWTPYLDQTNVQNSATPSYKQMDEAAKDDTAYDLFCHNAKVCQTTFKVPVSHQRGLSKDILPSLPEQSFDMVYIDGSHAFDDVNFDIEQGKRLVKDGGILCGDDLELGPEDFDDIDALRPHRNTDILMLDQGGYFHPGVTLAVADQLGQVSHYNGYWVMRREDEAFTEITFQDLQSFMPRFWDQTRRENFVKAMKQIADQGR